MPRSLLGFVAAATIGAFASTAVTVFAADRFDSRASGDVVHSHVEGSGAVLGDGSGGAFVVIEDPLPTPGTDDDTRLRVERISAAGAQLWGARGVAVATGTARQHHARLVPDGAGGVIVLWLDARLGGGDDAVYAQRVNGSGAAVWDPAGVAVCAAAESRREVTVAPDGSGGALVCWIDDRNTPATSIYAQRIPPSGTASWTANGVEIARLRAYSGLAIVSDGGAGAYVSWAGVPSSRPFGEDHDAFARRINGNGTLGSEQILCALSSYSTGAAVAADGSGGAFFAFADDRTGTPDVYVQHMNGVSGDLVWTTDGSRIAAPAAVYGSPIIAADGQGGCVVAWTDNRTIFGYDVYAQRSDADGGALWAAEGAPVNVLGGSNFDAAILPSGDGGAIVAWNRLNEGYEAVVQRLAANAGTPVWGVAGRVVGMGPGDQVQPAIAPDGQSGVVCAWLERHEAAGEVDVYAQRLNSAGNSLWAIDGVPCLVQGKERVPSNLAVAASGGVVVWAEKRGHSYDIVARRLLGGGEVLWGPIVVTSAVEDQFKPVAVSDESPGLGGAIVTWLDRRNGVPYELYAQRITSSGSVAWSSDVLVANGLTFGFVTASDGTGGAIVAWSERAAYPPIRVQRLGHDGEQLWGSTGKLVTTPRFASQDYPAVVASGGAAYVTWKEGHCWVNKLDADGNPVWGAGGLDLGTTAIGAPSIALNVSGGGVFVAWPSTNGVRAQWISEGGEPLYAPGGALISDESARFVSIISDGVYAAFVSWVRSSDNSVQVSKVDEILETTHATGGTAASTFPSVFGQAPVLVPDDQGGAIIVFSSTDGPSGSVRAQHYGFIGNITWGTNGVLVVDQPDVQWHVDASPDGAGGALVSWQDRREGSLNYVYTQRITSAGEIAPNWPGNGTTPVLASLVESTAETGRVRVVWQVSGGRSFRIERASTPERWTAIASRSLDGVNRVTFEDADVVAGERYGYRLMSEQGPIGEVWVEVPGLALSIAAIAPHPIVGVATVTVSLARGEPATIELVDVAGRRVWSQAVPAGAAGARRFAIGDAAIAPGVYRLRLRQGNRTVSRIACFVR